MEEEQKRFFYQPDLTTAIIDWSWTLLVLIIGIIIAFEITHFQWITALFIVIFLILAALQIFRRTVVISPSRFVFNRLLVKEYLSVPVKDIRQPIFTKHTLTITVHGEVMTFSFTQRSLNLIKHFLKEDGVLNDSEK
ncbi:EbsA family protein [Limosilactobacillus coleohominis]|uniref:VPDSG-CTERM exosortase interaction domain protein n=1 Tax=Limosilactobacillus coleohominis TaxID=181675 RepID=A0ABS2GUM0_9LACO|nr:EbsA family protein [Limosilactobacillus coleohominis]MBM6939940.1 VPDSG-CTERM exosortase interaction domain protein [Limosilactobacillus coleohominis]MBM6954297.1 VPDSG-CTERM exosortase interaction domain protein [Limosilactobacillus coleohominis]